MANRKVSSNKKVSSKPRRRAPTGATRKPKRVINFSQHKSVFVGVAGVLVVVLLIITIDFRAQLGKIEQLTRRPISSVLLRGEFNFISKDKIKSALKANLKEDFVNLDLEKLKKDLEFSPWIEEVKLSRVWPAKLVIEVREQVPIARWGEKGFINRFGKKISIDSNAMLSDLPQLSGPDTMVRDIASEYLRISRLFGEKGIQLTGVSVDGTRSWVLWVAGKRSIYMGADNLAAKLDLFLQIYEQHLANSLENVKKVDMRYKSGLAIEWIDSEKQMHAMSRLRQQNYASN